LSDDRQPQGSEGEPQTKSVATSSEAEKPRHGGEADGPAASRALAEVDEPGSELEQLQQKVSEQDETIRGQREQILRLQADFENYRRRQQNSLEDVKFLARESIVSNVLPLIDNLERALAAVQTTANVQALSEGIRLIHKQMVDILGKEGLSVIESDGQPFDPSLHEAVMTEERDDVPDQQIVETLQKGYRLGPRVLRASLVKVASNPNKS
jgi:molecular chaperone GrpE